ncbi:MAG: TetR/AcrR family transcriptional regulator [Phototrophicales bacterium]|nr:TetR/AcrR family transcriptional regulator [Phototrophicales bacterium]
MDDSDDNLLINATTTPRADALRNHALLLETARQLFVENGVGSVTMSQIAQSAGVGKGTLYRHFENKMAVCFALLDQDQRDLQESTLRYLRRNIPPYDQLRWFLEEVARFVIRNESLLRGFDISPETVSLQHPAHFWWRQTIRMLLVKLSAQGDVDYLTDTLYIMLHVDVVQFQQRRGYGVARILSGLMLLVDKFIAPPCGSEQSH